MIETASSSKTSRWQWEHRRAVEVGSSLETSEKALILATLEKLDGNKREAASVLGVSLKTLYNRLKDYEKAEEPEAELETNGNGRHE